MNLETNGVPVTGPEQQIATPIKKPEDVIGFLREFNFGNRDESAAKALGRFLSHMEDRADEKPVADQPSFKDLIIDELENAGFIEKGTVSREVWTHEAERALIEAVYDFDRRAKEWQKEVSKKHQDWRP